MDQEQVEREKKEFEGKSEQQFQYFMDGKQTSQGITDDMNLQDIFKQYYGKLKRAETTAKANDTVNSAMSSLGGLGQKLEKRRQAMRDKKEK